MIRFSPIDPMVSGSKPLAIKLHLELEGLLALCNARRRNCEMSLHRKEGSGHCLMRRNRLIVDYIYFRMLGEVL